jgi:hypothetical protein
MYEMGMDGSAKEKEDCVERWLPSQIKWKGVGPPSSLALIWGLGAGKKPK